MRIARRNFIRGLWVSEWASTTAPQSTRRRSRFRRRGEASYRIVQLTPPGSECSIQIGAGITRATPGSYQGMYLITSDIEATRAELVERGVDVSEPFHFGPEGQTPGLHPKRADYNSFLSFIDPDGKGWLIQEVKQRATGR
jgi:hypothetical protein